MSKSDDLRKIDRIVGQIASALEAARAATNPVDEAKAFGRAVSFVLPLRRAITDGRAASVARAMETGTLNSTDLAKELGVSRGFINQLAHRHGLTFGWTGTGKAPAAAKRTRKRAS